MSYISPRVEATRIRKAAEKIPPIDHCLERAISEHGDGCAISWSGGRCSTVVLHMALKIKPDIKVLFDDTGVEYPETYHFINKMRSEWDLKNFIRTTPEKTFWECVEEYGLPMTRSEMRRLDNRGVPKCCLYLKEIPAMKAIKEHHITCIFTGLRAAEARMRFFVIRNRGQYFYSKRWGCWRCHPIAFWSDLDMRNYIKENGMPLNCIYEKKDTEGNPISRCGCQPCTGFINWEKQLSATNPKLYEYVQRLKGQRLMRSFFYRGPLE